MTNEYLENYYAHYDEDARLASRHGSVEYLTTMRYLHKYLRPGASVLEVGAGTGRYSLALAREDFRVSALELMESNLAVFRAHLRPEDEIDVRQGDARDLSRYPDAAFDAVLVLGPLYHLYTEADKVRVLREARRVARPGGYIFAAHCLNEATIISWGFRGDGSNILGALEKDMLTKDWHCLSTEKDLFDLVRPADMDRLNALAGLACRERIATDLFTNYMRETVDAWSDEVFARYLDYHFTVCDRPDLIGLTHHLLDILQAEGEG